MPTQKINITSAAGWIQVASNTDINFLLQNGTMVPVKVCFYGQTGEPPEDQVGHTFYGREKMYRENVEGKIFVRYDDDWPIDTYIIVSKRST